MRKKSVLTGVLMLLSMLILAACGSSRQGSIVMGEHYYYGGEESTEEVDEVETEATESVKEQVSSDLLMIMKNDMTAEMMIVKQLSTGKQYMYYYSIGTSFLDKYGAHTSVSNFQPGKIVTIGSKNSDGKISTMQISDAVWEYADVKKYSVDEEKGVFMIAGTKYSYDSNLLINSDETVLTLSDLTQLDALRIIGIGKKIYSISVTTGHGILSLQNTEIFEGSYIQIGTKIFAEITENMQMELPEGNYTVTVANDGYGGSTDITVERGGTVTLDLDQLKGEGPKYGNILFGFTIEGATLYIDGQVVDYSQPISLRYGVHSLKVNVTGYEEWSKYLYVNSAEATVIIDPTDSDDDDDDDEETTSSDESTTSSESSETSSTDSDTTTADDLESDYLSTLTELLSSFN